MKHLMKNAGYLLTGCALVIALGSCGNSQTTSSSSTSDSSASASLATTPTPTPADSAGANNANAGANKDAAFVTDAAKGNAQEIQMLRAGAQQGTNKMLKADAKKMLADHMQLAQQMQDYATKKNITLSTDTTMDMGDMKTGNDFDKMWASKMVDGHQQMISKFETAQNSVADPELKTMITNTLPTLHSHLDMAQKLQSSLK